jgi:ABC-type multidrug transport system ATPase subunit
MNNHPQTSIRYFDTFEAREEEFRRAVSHLIPREYAGAAEFWRDFGQISFDESKKVFGRMGAYISSNPRDCLVYGTPWQVFAAAIMCARKTGGLPDGGVAQVAREFELSENLYQPIRTLSGGETVKVALGKSFIQAAQGSRLTIASPFSWLSKQNYSLFERLLARCRECRQSVDLLALKGEDSEEPVDAGRLFADRFSPPVDFRLRARGLRILLASPLNPIYSTECHARVDDLDAALRSPCLVVGDNGHGKTLLAKALAGAVAYRGSLEIRSQRRSGPVRMLFQDVLTQTLLRSFRVLSAGSTSERFERPIAIYEDIMRRHSAAMEILGCEPDVLQATASRAFRSLLEIKAILTAVRLCGQPAAVILDEPDWGLNRHAAIAFVAALLGAAHVRQIPVILISHKPWWSSIAGSALKLRRSTRNVDARRRYSFRIKISTVARAIE